MADGIIPQTIKGVSTIVIIQVKHKAFTCEPWVINGMKTDGNLGTQIMDKLMMTLKSGIKNTFKLDKSVQLLP